MTIALAVLLIHSDIAFFQKAETRAFHLVLTLIPLMVLSAALRRFGRLETFSLLRVAVNVFALLFLVRDRGLGVDGAILVFAAGHLVMIAVCL